MLQHTLRVTWEISTLVSHPWWTWPGCRDRIQIRLLYASECYSLNDIIFHWNTKLIWIIRIRHDCDADQHSGHRAGGGGGMKMNFTITSTVQLEVMINYRYTWLRNGFRISTRVYQGNHATMFTYIIFLSEYFLSVETQKSGISETSSDNDRLLSVITLKMRVLFCINGTSMLANIPIICRYSNSMFACYVTSARDNCNSADFVKTYYVKSQQPSLDMLGCQLGMRDETYM